MPDIKGSTEVDLANGVHNVTLANGKNRQVTGDGTTPSNVKVSGDVDRNNDTSIGDVQTSPKDWSDQAKEGVELNINPTEDDVGESSEESSDDDSSEEEDEIKAPFELLGEFLLYVRSSDWENAAKLCKMILIYEPNNPTALQFQSVIAEKSEIEKELAEMSSSSDEEEESSDEEDSDDEEDLENGVGIPDIGDDKKDDSPDEFKPRPGSTMKNKLMFPHLDPVWKP